MQILIVEDDDKTAALLVSYLEQAGYTTLRAADGQTAVEMARFHQPDLVILDLMLPILSGIEVCRELRADWDVPLIMLTARTTDDDILEGLAEGADDYITKPFSPREVVARVRSVIRRTQRDHRVLYIGNLMLDFQGYEVRLSGRRVHVTPTEFRLLEVMAAKPGRALSRDDLIQQTFGYDYDGMSRTIDAHIMNLRKKIEPDPTAPTYIQTVYGVGYRMAEGT